MKHIRKEIMGHVLTIGLDRPNKLNAFNLEMLHELSVCFDLLESDPNLRCALVYTTSNHFTSGLDLAEVGPHIRAGGSLFEETSIDPLQTMDQNRSKPVVIAVQGYCLTIGMELILATDICVAHPETKFGQIEVKRGIIPFGGATVRMVQRCGWGNAMRYLVTGDTFDGSEALRIGMIQELSANPFEKGLEIAKTIADQAPLAVQQTIKNARMSIAPNEVSTMKELIPIAKNLMDTQDAEEGLNSFIERRKARFYGK